MKNKIITLSLVLLLSLSLALGTPRGASAQASVVFDPFDLPQDIFTMVESTMTTIETTVTAVATDGMWVSDMIDRYLLPVLKTAAIQMMNQIVSNIVSGGGSGKPMFVTNWDDYLFKTPERETKVYMNSFFNSISAGRLSSLNYEGAGQSYDVYLKKQAESILFSSTNALTTSINNYTINPQKELFSGGNMKGFSAFLQCQNNPACYSLAANMAYTEKLNQVQTIATKEVNASGYLPKKMGDRIVTPGSQFQSAMESVSQLGGQMIVNATKKEELLSNVVNVAVNMLVRYLTSGISS